MSEQELVAAHKNSLNLRSLPMKPLQKIGETVSTIVEKHQRKQLGKKAMEHLERNGETYRQEVVQAFGSVEFFLGVTAVHGLEPQQIAVNTALAINAELAKNGLDARPVIIPYVPGHPSYGNITKEVLLSAYTPEQQKLIYLSEDLGKILIQTQYEAKKGYQEHLRSVKKNQPVVQQQLLQLIDGPISTVRLLDNQPVVVNGEGRENKRIIEVNAGANVSAATKDGKVATYTVFPNTFEGILKFIRWENRRAKLRYSRKLLREVGKSARALDRKTTLSFLSDPNPLQGTAKWRKVQRWMEMRDKTLTPPLKEMLIPPKVTVAKNHIKIEKSDGTILESDAYHPDKGLIHVNISGNTAGSQAARELALKAQKEGYIVTLPPWIKELWLTQVPAQEKQDVERILPLDPNILFAKDGKGQPLCKFFLMRPGLGSIWYSLKAGVPILSIPREEQDNPEMEGNNKAIERFGIGTIYDASRTDNFDRVRALQPNIENFAMRQNKKHKIPEGMSGLGFVAQMIINAEILRKEERSSTK